MDTLTHLIKTGQFFNDELVKYFDPRNQLFEEQEEAREEGRNKPKKGDRDD